jgi:hypothetical protein
MLKTVVLPTTGIVRAFTIATDSTVKPKSRTTKEQKVSYLRSHPAEARALLVQAGQPVGKRGRLSTEQFATAADLIA